MDLAQAIEAAARGQNIPAEYLLAIAQLESNMRVDAKNPWSSAGGPFQFVDGTAAEYGLTGNLRYDPVASSNAAAKMMATNMRSLTRVLGREPTVGELYLAHQQGLGGAQALLANPGANVVDALARAYGGDRAKAQKVVTQNGGNPNMTAGQFSNQWITKANTAAKNLPPANVGSQNAVASELSVTRPVTPSMPTPVSQRPVQTAYLPTPAEERGIDWSQVPVGAPIAVLPTTTAPATATAPRGSSQQNIQEQRSEQLAQRQSAMLPPIDWTSVPVASGTTIATIPTTQPNPAMPATGQIAQASNSFFSSVLEALGSLASAVPAMAPAAPAPVAAPAPAASAPYIPRDGLVATPAANSGSAQKNIQNQRAEQLAQRQAAASALLPLITPSSKEQVESGTGFRLPSGQPTTGVNNNKVQDRLAPNPIQAPTTQTVQKRNVEYDKLMQRVQQGQIELKGMTPSGMAMSRDARTRYEQSLASLEALQKALASTPQYVKQTVTVQPQQSSGGGGGGGSSYIPTSFQGVSSGKTYTEGQKYTMGGDTYTANANGSFTSDSTGKTLGGSSGTNVYYDTDSNTFKYR